MPKKLDIELKVPNGDDLSIGFEKYRSVGGGKLIKGEEALPEDAKEEAEVEPSIDSALLNQVL